MSDHTNTEIDVFDLGCLLEIDDDENAFLAMAISIIDKMDGERALLTATTLLRFCKAKKAGKVLNIPDWWGDDASELTNQLVKNIKLTIVNDNTDAISEDAPMQLKSSQLEQHIQNDPTTSYWLKSALKECNSRDKNDVLNDLEALFTIFANK